MDLCSDFQMQTYASIRSHRISLFLFHPQVPAGRSPLVLPRVRRQVCVFVRASTGDGLINEPDQAKGFLQDIQRCVVISILRELGVRTFGVLAEEHAVRQLHGFPLPATAMAGFTRWKEAVDLDHLPASLLHFAAKQRAQFASRRVRKRASQRAIFQQPFEVEVLNANHPVTGGEPGGQLVEHIIAQAGDPVVQPCHLPTRFLPVF